MPLHHDNHTNPYNLLKTQTTIKFPPSMILVSNLACTTNLTYAISVSSKHHQYLTSLFLRGCGSCDL